MTFDQTHRAPVRQPRQLPSHYYHEHFLEMLAFVERHYAHVLRQPHADFLAQFRALPHDAQCLYVRLVNRKGRVFAINKLRYPEIGPVAPLVRCLRDAGFAGAPGAEHFDDLLRFLTKAEIHGALQADIAGVSRSLKKDELADIARERCDRAAFVARIGAERLCVQQRCEETRYLLFLYFGRVTDGLSQFTMRDLGLVRTNTLRDSYDARFDEREEAEEHYYFASRLAHLDDKAGQTASIEEPADWPEPDFAGSARLRDKLAYRLGRRAEKAGNVAEALSVYRAGESARCTERVIRLLLAQGERDAARQLLERCLQEPRSEEERLLAADLYARKFEKKRTSTVTDTLRAGETIELDESLSGSPERAAARFFEQQGQKAYRVENQLWRTLFGLLFWNELFIEKDARLHSPFEFLPGALADNSFAERHAAAIAARLERVGDPSALKRALLKTSTAYYGTPNGVFRWRRSVLDALFALVAHAPADALRAMLTRLCNDYKRSRYGYPDLMLIDDDGVRFVEIKAEGDALRRNQLLRLEQLSAAGFRADVVRVRWILDPDQVYVVVDVETTGGRGEQHRVTEIGAVKVRNGRVVDRFQTLLNPQRSIPPGITRLTGITPEMVADAPYFIDIADDFEAFMGDAIFVAHNVDFDYRFISQEFRRIGRPFRHAKLCTCASMRKLYPGHRSYSLAALTEAFGIELRDHHRALCDAEAAAELLLLVNEKRQQKLRERGP